MIPTLHPEVDNDLVDIVEYYSREAGRDLAIEFYWEFRRCADQIGSRPGSFPLWSDRLRRMNLRRFPFHILFEIFEDSSVQLLVVKHDRRDPSFGTDRK